MSSIWSLIGCRASVAALTPVEPLLQFLDAGEAPVRSIRPMTLTISGALVAALFCNRVHAEVRVQGDVRDLRVEVHDATVNEILAALAERFALRYRGSPGGDGITATFEGPLRNVVMRVLGSYNYVMRASGDGLDVVVLSTKSPHAVVPPTIAPPTYPSKSTRRNE